ncbi:DUF192 domain-containing protein [Myxococcota bacterium]|nr:DUF192 domain-containing protein [Myxococcota bacterium]MBU1537902.1 DUF192 domain-containing protein [Myxococcota bacterium]
MSTIPDNSRQNGVLFRASIENGPEIGRRIRLASSWGSRLKGLLGTKSLDEDEGLLLVPCTSIHMFFMSIPLDVLFLSADGVVVAVYHTIKPWRISRHHGNALGVLELPAGRAKELEIEVGDRILFCEPPS